MTNSFWFAIAEQMRKLLIWSIDRFLQVVHSSRSGNSLYSNRLLGDNSWLCFWLDSFISYQPSYSRGGQFPLFNLLHVLVAQISLRYVRQCSQRNICDFVRSTKLYCIELKPLYKLGSGFCQKNETKNLELNISFTFGQPLLLNAGKDLSHWFEPRTYEGDDELEVRLWYHPILRINTYFTPEVCSSGIVLQRYLKTFEWCKGIQSNLKWTVSLSRHFSMI